jgi:ATP-binding cassette subfamily B protein
MTVRETPLPKFRDIEIRRQDRLGPRSPRSLPRLLAKALVLVYGADRRRTVVMVLLSVLTALLGAAQVLAAKFVLDALLLLDRNGGSTTEVLVPLLAMVGASVAAATVTAVQTQQQRYLAEAVQQSATQHLVRACADVPLLRFEDPKFFDQLQRVQTSALSRPFAVAMGVTNVVSGAAGVVAITIVLIGLAPILVPVLLIGGIPALLVSRYASRTEFVFSVDQSARQRLRLYLQMLLINRETAKEIRAFGSAELLTHRWRSTSLEYLAALRQQVRRRSWLAASSSLLSGVTGLVAAFLLVMLLVNGRLDLASAGAALAAVRLLGSRVGSVTSGIGGLFESAIFLADLDDFIALEPASRRADVRHPEVSAPAEIRVQDVHFRYPLSARDTIDGVDLVVRQGEIVALVGENGSGKTTLAKLLATLYAPTSGLITWDGVDVQLLSPDARRDAIAVVFQDFIKYALPAVDNIGLGRPDCADDLDGVISAARHSGAHDFLSALPDGYSTYLGGTYSGQDLSLGQWQRVALARAFFRNAPFVILDEPTASLDPRAEHELFARVGELLAGRTVLLISHRFSSVRHADRIYVMDAGRIVEQGSHEDLMAAAGRYAELFTLQAAAYLETQPGTSV